jgi:TonB family protein
MSELVSADARMVRFRDFFLTYCTGKRRHFPTACSRYESPPNLNVYASRRDRCNHGVEILQQFTPDYPQIVRSLPLGDRTVSVRLTVTASGRPSAMSISQSSGNADLDRAALDAARKSTYASAAENCKPVASSYRFNVIFSTAGAQRYR